ncbi:MAG: TonB-dependent receptor [Cyanobacteria bacterium]|nr:TonB-dependent receptor [Cyanobacteriota bacterium]
MAVAVLLPSLNAAAQTAAGTSLSGVITRTENNQPLSGALVVIDELRREVRAGDDGAYRFENVPPGQYHVGVRAEGYSTKRTEVTVGATPATLNLSIDFDLHFEEVLSVSPTARPQFESYQPTTVLDGQELTKNLEATIGATLSEAPGVALREFGAAPARPIIRGLDGDRISVLEDGQRMGDLSSQSGDHAVPTNPAAARRIEVVRGPATLLYGANAIGGLVNVITDSIPSQRTQGASGNFTFNFGSNGGAAGAAGDIHVGNGKYALHVGGAGNRSGNYDTPDGEVDNSRMRTGMAQMGVSRTGEKHYVGASYGYDDSKYGIPIVDQGRIALTPKRHSLSARAGGQNLDGWLQSYRATLGVRRYRHSELEGSEIGTTFYNDTVEGEVLLSHRRSGQLVGSFGGWFLDRAFDVVGAEALSPPVDQRAAAAFVYEEIESPHATLQFGGRIDHSNYTPIDARARTFNEWSASAGALFKPVAAKDNVVIAINLARASRYPSLQELYYFGRHPGNLSFEIGNADLGAEHALGLDVSLRGRGTRFEAEVTLFRNDISKYIFRRPTGGIADGFPIVRNLAADSVLRGVEAHADVKLTPDITAEVTYDMVRGELKDDGGALPRIPPQRVIAGLTYQKNAFQFGGSAQFVADQPRVFGAELPTDGYTTAKLFASYSFQSGGVLNTITARLDNATDRLYRNHLNYLKDVLAETGRSFKVVYSTGF